MVKSYAEELQPVIGIAWIFACRLRRKMVCHDRRTKQREPQSALVGICRQDIRTDNTDFRAVLQFEEHPVADRKFIAVEITFKALSGRRPVDALDGPCMERKDQFKNFEFRKPGNLQRQLVKRGI